MKHDATPEDKIFSHVFYVVICRVGGEKKKHLASSGMGLFKINKELFHYLLEVVLHSRTL